jgi:hypothetical protein
MSTPPIRPVRVSARRLRDLFNERFAQRLSSCRRIVERDDHPNPPPRGEQLCTRSQYISYVDDNDEPVVEVHQYVRAGGIIGGSGRPDPKLLVIDGTIYIPETPTPAREARDD